MNGLLDQAFIGGYFLYLVAIFLPGIGLGELLGVWEGSDIISERLAIAFGLGLSVDAIVLFLKTSNIGGLIGIDLTTIYGIILLGFIFMLISIGIRRRFEFPTRPVRNDVIILSSIALLIVILATYFQQYPIFPEYQSPDFKNHVELAQALISGSFTSIPQGILYNGVRYQLATGILLVGGEPLVTTRVTMAFLTAISPILIFSAAKKIFQDNATVGLIATFVYALTGIIWFPMLFDSGLYANFYGVLSALFLLVVFFRILRSYKSKSVWCLFILAISNAYVSHYTILTLFPVMLIIPLVEYFYLRRNSKKKEQTNKSAIDKLKEFTSSYYLIPGMIVILPAIVGGIFYPSLVQQILSLGSSSDVSIVTGNTFLSNALSAVPFLQYLALGVFDDLEFSVLVLLAIISTYKLIGLRSWLSLIPLGWFIVLFAAAPSSLIAWRFSLVALVPLVLMSSFGIFVIWSALRGVNNVGFTRRMKSGKVAGRSPLLTLFIMACIIGSVILGSYGTAVITSAASDGSVISQSQYYVYNAVYWLSTNTPNGSKYLSVSDWRFTYTDLIIGRLSFFDYSRIPSDAIKIANNESAGYILVTNTVTLALPPVPQLFPWNNFPASSNSNLTLVYQNPDVRIYKIVTAA